MQFNDFNDVIGFAEIIGAIAIAFIYIRSRIPKETIEQQTKLIEALNGRLDSLDAENKEMHRQHVENQKAIADLQGQIKVYKELPLQDIAKSLKALENLPTEFEKMSEKSAKNIIEAIGNIKNQHVENQTVNRETVNTKNV